MSDAKSLYVSRDLINAASLVTWAKNQGLHKSLSPDDMHVTIAFSRSKVDWDEIGTAPASVSVHNGERAIEKLGDGSALVLRFSSADLTKRWEKLKSLGASWDWPSYKPHITVSYDGADVDISAISPYDGPLEFGPEIVAEVKEDWKPKVAEDAIPILKEMRQDRIALDRASVRTFDSDGHMHVESTNISKATVNPYRGAEIPGADELGLDPDRIYQLLRDPDELAKAAKSFDGKPLVLAHKPTSAADHDHENVVGSISNPVFEAPYLKAQLVVWTDEAIKAIQSEAQKQLSCGYRYRADMTPGTYQGTRYDGVMRDIVGNHTALVKEGRAGPDVMVGDSKENLFMTTNKVTLSRTGLLAQGALSVFLKPKMAMDAKIDLTPILATLTSKNFAERKPTIAMDVVRKITGKLAKDEAVESDDVIGALETILPMLAESEESAAGDDDDPDAMDSDESDMVEKLKAMGYSVTKEPVAASDADDPDKKELADKLAAKDAEMKNMVTKTAMDAALKAAVETVTRNQTAIRDAERIVQPWVGILPLAHDSAAGVYRTALGALGVKDIDKLHPDALLPILQAQPKPGDKQTNVPAFIAQDTASRKDYDTRFPNANRLKN